MPLGADDVAVFFDADMPGYVEAVIDGVPVGALDRRKGYAEAFGLVAGSPPALLVPESVVVDRGSSVILGAEAHVVTDVRRDGIGRLRLILETP